MSTSPNPNPPAAPAAPVEPPVGGSAPPARPDFIPEKFWDPAANAPKIEDLAKAYQNLETHQGNLKQTWEQERLAARPEAADKYEFEVAGLDAETIAKLPLTAALREVAFDLGLDPEAAKGIGSKVLGALIKDMPDPAAEKALLGPQADQRLAAVDAYLTQTFTDPAEKAAFDYFGRNAAGVRALEKLIAAAQGKGGEPLRGGADAPTNTVKTRAEIHALMNDERYWHPQKKDRAFVDMVIRENERTVANGAS